jgi:hypothetical protein
MPTPSFDDLMTPLTDDQVLASELQTAVLLQMPVSAWQDGGVVREMLEINATAVSVTSQLAIPALKAGFLDFSSGDWLTLEADQTFDVQRIEATFATGTLLLYNAGSITYTLNPGDVRAYDAGTITNPGNDPASPSTQVGLTAPVLRIGGTGATYTSTTGGVLLPGQTISVTLVADEAGSASGAVPGAISALATPLSGVFVSNPALLSGEDEESDPNLRARCRESMARASPNGPADAYRYFATSAVLANGSPAGITKVYVQQLDGSVVVYCGDDAGPASGAVGDTTAPLGAADFAIQSNCVPTGIAETTLAAIPVPVSVSLTVYLSPTATISNDDAIVAAQKGVAALFVAVPIGGFNVPDVGRGIFTNNFETAVFDALAGQALQVIMILPVPSTTPLAVSMTSPQIAVLQGTVGVSVVRVAQATS